MLDPSSILVGGIVGALASWYITAWFGDRKEIELISLREDERLRKNVIAIERNQMRTAANAVIAAQRRYISNDKHHEDATALLVAGFSIEVLEEALENTKTPLCIDSKGDNGD